MYIEYSSNHAWILRGDVLLNNFFYNPPPTLQPNSLYTLHFLSFA